MIFSKYILPYFQYLWTGRMLNAYWYIPFIIVTFLISPSRQQLVLIASSLMTDIMIQGPVDNLSLFQSIIFFTPIYLIGIFCSIHKEKIWVALAGKELWLLLIVIALAYIQAALGKGGNYHSDFLQFNGVDIQLIQKLIFCFFLYGFVAPLGRKEWKWCGLIADTSFAIFFYMISLFS